MKILCLLAALAMALMVGCSDEDEPTGPGPSGPIPNQGTFVAQCAGLEYVSAAGTAEQVSGVTDSSGTFTYVPGHTVKFLVGGIYLGEAPAASVLTPLHLTGIYSVSYDPVTNIARFLQTLDDDADLSNGIQVTAAVRAAAASDSLYFGYHIDGFESDSIVTDVISRLTTATQAGERLLVPVAEAQEHLSREVRAAYEHTYSGNYCRWAAQGLVRGGTWTMEVRELGLIGGMTITFRGVPSFTVTGFMNWSGTVEFTAPLATIRGSFNPTFGGSWDFWGNGLSGGVFYLGSGRCPREQ